MVLLSGGRLGHVLGPHSETEMRGLFAVFALGFTAIALEMVLLNFRAWQLQEPLRLNARERAMTFRELTGLEYPGSGRNCFARVGTTTAERANQVEWLDLFFDDYFGAVTQGLLKAEAMIRSI